MAGHNYNGRNKNFENFNLIMYFHIEFKNNTKKYFIIDFYSMQNIY